MNKDEFKQLILAQFKHEDAPIHKIMFNSTLKQGRYLDKAVFTAKEFGLDVHVETIDDETGKFQILFQEQSSAKASKSQYFIDLNDAALTNQVYIEEVLNVNQDKIRFAMDMFCLEVNNYRFHKDTESFDGAELTYDIKKGAFEGNVSMDEFIELCNGHRNTGFWHFADLTLGENKLQQIEDAIHAYAREELMKQTLADTFKNQDFSVRESKLAQLIRRLASWETATC